MPRISVRRTLLEDVPELQRISRVTLFETHRHFMNEKGLKGYIDSGECDKYVLDNVNHSHTALLQTRVIGQAVCKDNLIDMMMIDLPLHRQGYGGELLHEIEFILFRQHHELFLECFEANEPSNAFYRKHGWREIQRFDDPYLKQRKIKYAKSIAPEAKK